ncbi:unnamed protein product [Fraxinus pennsylvanica]|uniref:Uncharacterized protein n=1 Tax=Fraxinus pennsylvanica TaxID=56036 RepID=A0AAD1ZSA6_9LAMI|nr:unnamed protein product [Fraxinus pennsylvanica]
MSETGAHSFTINIDKILKSSSLTPSEPSMFRVGDHLRSINPEAYDPEIIAFGPFHRVPREDLPEILLVNALHLVGIVHDIQCSSFATVVSPMDAGNPCKVANINSVVELKEVGISIQKSAYHSLLRIEFENKAMKIAE